MLPAQLIQALKDLSSVNEVYNIPISYEDFRINLKLIVNRLGDTGLAMYTENRIIVCFDSNEFIRLTIKCDDPVTKDDILKWGLKLKIIGEGISEIQKPRSIFWRDFKDNLKKILILTAVYAILVCPWNFNIQQVMILNEKMVDIISIFIGMVFVFIGFFYGDKESAIDTYKKGNGDKKFNNDKYVIQLSITAIVLPVLSLLIGNLQDEDFPKDLLRFFKNCLYVPTIIQYIVCASLTLVALWLIIICFDSLINYYLRNLRYRYFIDAFDDLINERKRK